MRISTTSFCLAKLAVTVFIAPIARSILSRHTRTFSAIVAMGCTFLCREDRLLESYESSVFCSLSVSRAEESAKEGASWSCTREWCWVSKDWRVARWDINIIIIMEEEEIPTAVVISQQATLRKDSTF